MLAAARRSGEDGLLVGVDLNENMLARAVAQVRHHGLRNVDLQVMDAQRLTFEGEFDHVFCGFALDSLPNREAALTGMRRALRPGGQLGLVEAPSWFFLHDPRWAGQGEVFKRSGVAVGDYQPDRERDDLIDALGRAGLHNITATHESYPLVFSDEQEWWKWMWSQGSRTLLEAIPGEQLDALRTALTAALPAPDEDGRIHGKMSAHLLLARTSGREEEWNGN